jgi:hypothetical protein
MAFVSYKDIEKKRRTTQNLKIRTKSTTIAMNQINFACKHYNHKPKPRLPLNQTYASHKGEREA